MFFKEDDTLAKMNANRILHVEENLESEDSYEDLREEPIFKQKKPFNPEPLKRILRKTIWIIPIVAISIIGYKILNPHNPLIGKWKPISKSAFSLGEIEFTKEKFHTNGNSNKIKYEIDSDKVSIVDEIGTSIVFYIKDDKTIENNLLGNKTTYKKAP